MLYDPELSRNSGETFRPGFSDAVMMQVVRDVRRTSEFAPSQAMFPDMCKKQRMKFFWWANQSTRLAMIRQNAEGVLLKLGELEVPEDEFFGLDNKGMKLALKRWLYGEQAGCRY